MGGVDTDMNGRASLKYLWVCGEASSTGLHGANRLASNGLLEALVYARAAARDIAATMPAADHAALVEIAFADGGALPDPAAVAELRRTMTEHVGLRRGAAGLKTALRIIARLETAHPAPGFQNMTATATLIAAAALQRQESRGGHFRDDFPDADPTQAARTHITLEQALKIRDAALKETTI